MKIRTVIVDDEPLAIEVIETYLKNFSDIEIIAKCGDGIQAFNILQQKKADLMFLDVKMPGLNGTELLKSLKNPPKVIFTTAYHDYAVEGFELNALDYLLKPVSFDRFLKAMEKVYEHFGFTARQNIQTGIIPARNQDIFLYLKVDRRMVKVDVKDILWIESQKDYIKVVLSDKELISKQKISILEELLPEEEFLRIHRSFIIAVNKIESFNSSKIEIGAKELPIGRNYKNDCQRRLNQYG
ncbi:LytTR family DNA-binding domain-containing protein [Daejeonella sp.]|uniref:LytR/AlgR family response regulator transcription factor n=1 Tax=Daejeonella sp. TaxID=2805397 RepID=UPI0027316071|nr:response regulator transcription factor [Daejeonella sp.]MDP2415270.1 response regulator transcription factor [Daejeonella sp.]